MDTQFWIERWSRREIGFHQRDINSNLQRYWAQLHVPKGAAVFVPLCGKSLDMRWLMEQGHPVVGVELAREAIREFFADWGVEPQVVREGPFERWRADGIELLGGDFFALTRSDLANVRAVFDRAALIALSREMRQEYVAKLREILPGNTQSLLITVDYPQHEMSGPPFAVTDDEVHALFSDRKIHLLSEVDVLGSDENVKFRERGLSHLIERVYRIE